MTEQAYHVSYHPDVKAADLPKIDQIAREMIKRAIEERLLTHPETYGKRLQRTLKDYWKLRVGPYRIIYKIQEKHITVLGILHRRYVYQCIERRG